MNDKQFFHIATVALDAKDARQRKRVRSLIVALLSSYLVIFILLLSHVRVLDAMIVFALRELAVESLVTPLLVYATLVGLLMFYSLGLAWRFVSGDTQHKRLQQIISALLDSGAKTDTSERVDNTKTALQKLFADVPDKKVPEKIRTLIRKG